MKRVPDLLQGLGAEEWGLSRITRTSKIAILSGMREWVGGGMGGVHRTVVMWKKKVHFQKASTNRSYEYSKQLFLTENVKM